LEAVTKGDRQLAEAVNFMALLYGQGRPGWYGMWPAPTTWTLKTKMQPYPENQWDMCLGERQCG
jgi:hypothetical protein